jgi:hypothetical protein
LLVWPAFVLWGIVLVIVVLTVQILRARRQPLWIVVLGALGAAWGSYIVGLVVLIALNHSLF